jgi:CheY-like chemotaxis protein
MRILVADQNALLLAAIAATFGRHCEIVTATRRDACMEHVEHGKFDVVVACEKLADYTGLELLSEVEAVSPPTLRIFAARPETLQRLGKRLDFFGLLGTLSYPIEARKLLVALKVARAILPGHPKALAEPGHAVPNVVPHVVRHVVLENEWDTGERLALLGQELEDAREAAHRAEAATVDETTAPQRLDSDEPAAEVWAAPPEASTAVGSSGIEHAAVERARQIADASSFEVSFEVCFDENPSRFNATAHGGMAGGGTGNDAWVDTIADVGAGTVAYSFADVSADTAGSTGADTSADVGTATSAGMGAGTFVDEGAGTGAEPFAEVAPSLEVSFDGNPSPPAAASTKSLEEEPPSASAAAAQSSPYVDSGAANDELFSATSAPPAKARASTARGNASAAGSGITPGATSAPAKQAAARGASALTAASAPRPAASKPSTTKGPRPRTPTVPTAAQREAFQRALARRNAARAGDVQAPPFVDFSAMGGMSATSPAAQSAARSSESLSDLARMATTKRALPGARRGSMQPKHRIFVVGSGIAAVLLVGVVGFEVLRTSSSGEHGRHGRAATAQLFSPPSTLVADNSANPPAVFSPPSPQRVPAAPAPAATSGLPQPQTFNPDTAPPDPPPPPPLERPGPMEPPSMGHNGPPFGMQGVPESE